MAGEAEDTKQALLYEGVPLSHHRRRPCDCRRLCSCVCAACSSLLLYGAFSVRFAERPGLRVRQLLQPLQWAMVGSNTYRRRGYEIVSIPPSIHGKLEELVVDGQSRISFGGVNEPLEDSIIFGRSERIYMTSTLQAEVVAAFRPLVAQFCQCELEAHAVVGSGGVRVYKHGATLAPHLDWAHKFVVSATLNVKQSANRSRWPLQMQAIGRKPHAVVHAEGEAVLYEGSRMLHGRPTPLPDDLYAAAFVGFVPKNYPTGTGLLNSIFVSLVRRFS